VVFKYTIPLLLKNFTPRLGYYLYITNVKLSVTYDYALCCITAVKNIKMRVTISIIAP